MNRPVISAIGHVTFQVADLDACVEVATNVMGLSLRREGPGFAELTEGPLHHTLKYIDADANALDHVGLEAPDADALAEARTRLQDAGYPIVSETPFDDVLTEGFAVEAPGGYVFEIYTGMPKAPIERHTAGVRPNRFGHVNVSPKETEPLRAFFGLLDFKVTDTVIGGYFMRCNVDHHGVAFLPGPGTFHHHAWEVQSTVELGLLADRIHERGSSTLWGPVRHGCGRNIAVYFESPDGTVVEYYCDMDRYYGDGPAPDEITQWDMNDHKWYSLWTNHLPVDRFRELGVVPGVPEGARA